MDCILLYYEFFFSIILFSFLLSFFSLSQIMNTQYMCCSFVSSRNRCGIWFYCDDGEWICWNSTGFYGLRWGGGYRRRGLDSTQRLSDPEFVRDCHRTGLDENQAVSPRTIRLCLGSGGRGPSGSWRGVVRTNGRRNNFIGSLWMVAPVKPNF